MISYQLSVISSLRKLPTPPCPPDVGRVGGAHPTPYTLHPTPHTPHPTLFTE
ncbi:MAG: hypothetical protein ACK47N_02345 [Microcystis sp.]|uniref:hypothetical protein n=1 Tax=Microcystis sp. TaxID=1127 RepID=UPI00391AF636